MPGSFLQAYFPNPWFAWAFYGALVIILAIATYFDLKYLKIPKQVTLSCLALGFAVNLVRGAWMGVREDDWLGGLGEGLLFSLLGFATGFGIFLGMWLLGLCAGGDVKSFAAVGSWIGFKFTFWLWGGSLITLIVIAGSRYVLHALIKGAASARKAFSARANPAGKGKSLQSRNRLLAYSLPLAIATALMLLWFFRADLRLVHPAKANDAKAMTLAQP